MQARIIARGVAFLAIMAISGCDTYHFLAGTLQDDTHRPLAAVRNYEAFLSSRPYDPRACEVRLRLGELYRGWERCDDARRHFEAAVRDFPKMNECATRAKLSVLSCPDYFPLDLGRAWVYADSASKGKAMRLDWEVRKSSGPGGGAISTALFAGNHRIREASESYAKSDWAVWRTDGAIREPFLKYPFRQDQAWSGRRGGAAVDWLVISTTQTIKVAAGEFSNCLKVREWDRRFPRTWRYDYYCPGVGRVKTTVGGPGFENPNTELLRFDKMN